MNLSVEYNQEKTKAQVLLPGLAVDDFDRTGTIMTHLNYVKHVKCCLSFYKTINTNQCLV